jgi:hypothetical protein
VGTWTTSISTTVFARLLLFICALTTCCFSVSPAHTCRTVNHLLDSLPPQCPVSHKWSRATQWNRPLSERKVPFLHSNGFPISILALLSFPPTTGAPSQVKITNLPTFSLTLSCPGEAESPSRNAPSSGFRIASPVIGTM